jgi:hypothetical protein
VFALSRKLQLDVRRCFVPIRYAGEQLVFVGKFFVPLDVLLDVISTPDSTGEDNHLGEALIPCLIQETKDEGGIPLSELMSEAPDFQLRLVLLHAMGNTKFLPHMFHDPVEGPAIIDVELLYQGSEGLKSSMPSFLRIDSLIAWPGLAHSRVNRL